MERQRHHHDGHARPPEEWAQFLTPDYRAHFEQLGEDLVRANVSGHYYPVESKHYAALAWVREKRAAREKRETKLSFHVKWTFWAAAATLVVATVGVIVTVWLAK